MKTFAFTLLVLLAMVQLMAEPSEAIPCSQIEGALAPCIPYLTSGGGAPSPQCCNGVRSIKSMTPTQADRQSACGCVKAAATRYKTIKDDVAAALPQKCNVQINVPISRNVDCSKIP